MVAFLYKPEVQAKEESQRAADVNPLVLAPHLFLFLSLLLLFFFFPLLPTLFLMALSPPTALGWVCIAYFSSFKTIDPWNAVLTLTHNYPEELLGLKRLAP